MRSSDTDEGNYTTTRPLETRIGLHQQFSVNPYGWHRWLLDELSLKPGSSIVELGCGTGALWSFAKSAELEGVKLHLFDKSQAMLDSATQKLAHIEAVKVENIDLDTAFELPIVPDILIANHVLYHTKNPEVTLASIADQISDSTVCVFATNGMASMSSIKRFFPERLRDETLHLLIENFTLESGYEVLCRVFGSAQVVRYADSLHITQAAPLVSYIESLPYDITVQERDEIEQLANDHISRYGAIFIEKDTGYLRCTRTQ